MVEHQYLFKDGIFYSLFNCFPIENVWQSWPIKIDYGQQIAKIGYKMADG